MQQVSSNLTLILKIFIPTFWLTLFGAFTIAVFLVDTSYFGNIPAFLFRVGTALFYLIGAGILYLTLLRLKRVEMSEEFVYATNYFRSYRYPWHNVDRLREKDWGIFSIVTVALHQPGHFGRKFIFLASRKRLQEFFLQHPALAEKVWNVE